MLPKYTYFKLLDPAAHKYSNTLEYRRDLVKRQITLCKNNINTLNLESQKIRKKLESSILHNTTVYEQDLPLNNWQGIICH